MLTIAISIASGVEAIIQPLPDVRPRVPARDAARARRCARLPEPARHEGIDRGADADLRAASSITHLAILGLGRRRREWHELGPTIAETAHYTQDFAARSGPAATVALRS